MSKFQTYGQQADSIVKDAFKKYQEAAAAYERAKAQAKKFPERQGIVDAEYAAQCFGAKADLMRAEEAMKKAKEALANHGSELDALRKQLAAEVEEHYAADPAAIDPATLELLKSGIMSPSEYSRLINKALSEGNYTTARICAKYAAEAGATRAKAFGVNDGKAAEYRAASFLIGMDNGEGVLNAFDMLANTFNMAVNNPGMIDHWDELTGPVIANM